jgi:hypothetical protein
MPSIIHPQFRYRPRHNHVINSENTLRSCFTRGEKRDKCDSGRNVTRGATQATSILMNVEASNIISPKGTLTFCIFLALSKRCLIYHAYSIDFKSNYSTMQSNSKPSKARPRNPGIQGCYCPLQALQRPSVRWHSR